MKRTLESVYMRFQAKSDISLPDSPFRNKFTDSVAVDSSISESERELGHEDSQANANEHDFLVQKLVTPTIHDSLKSVLSNAKQPNLSDPTSSTLAGFPANFKAVRPAPKPPMPLLAHRHAHVSTPTSATADPLIHAQMSPPLVEESEQSHKPPTFPQAPMPPRPPPPPPPPTAQLRTIHKLPMHGSDTSASSSLSQPYRLAPPPLLNAPPPPIPTFNQQSTSTTPRLKLHRTFSVKTAAGSKMKVSRKIFSSSIDSSLIFPVSHSFGIRLRVPLLVKLSGLLSMGTHLK